MFMHFSNVIQNSSSHYVDKLFTDIIFPYALMDCDVTCD